MEQVDEEKESVNQSGVHSLLHYLSHTESIFEEKASVDVESLCLDRARTTTHTRSLFASTGSFRHIETGR